jgi:effector-binding domain-containing protein
VNTKPIVKELDEKSYYGIRFTAPYRGMFSRVTAEFRNLDLWIRENRSVEFGSRFLRYHLIDMRGIMDLEIGIFTATNNLINSTVSTGVIPCGRYATMIYRGLGLAANKTLLDWINENGFKIDKKSQINGDAFACRYEAYLTDPKLEPRKKQWDIELAIKLLH